MIGRVYVGLLALALAGCGQGGGGQPLLAAAGARVISPDAQNHPETVYLAGVVPSRLASGVHDDLLASALVLSQGDEHLVLVSLDLTGFTRSRIREIQERLSLAGIDPERVWIASTHTHEAPDTVGVYGPDLLTTGASPTYIAFIQDQVVGLVTELWDQRTRVRMRAATATIDDPEANHPTWINDFRHPLVTVPSLSVAVFEDRQDRVVASLVNWHSHPEVMIDQTLVTSDFPGWVRQAMQAELGGTCVYLTGAVGGLSSPTGASVPGIAADGEPMLDADGQPVYLLEASWDKTRSMGWGVAERALKALAAAEPVKRPTLTVRVERVLIPLTNDLMVLAFQAGLVQYDAQDLVTGRPATCGSFGCADERIGLARLGPLALLTSPGETLPETWIGRPASEHDFGGEWGVAHFGALEGLAGALDAQVPMHMGLCGDEIGYLLPQADAHPPGHPEYYEEDLVFCPQVEDVYRQAVDALLGR